ncbi:MAG: hypothetical protein AAF570_29485, partial [Bacteroidota bacterium]
PGTAVAPFDNERQKAIFDDIYGAPGVYDAFINAWDENTVMHDTPIRQLVYDLKRMDSINRDNSLAVLEFYRAVRKCTPKSAANSPEVATVIARIANLTAVDKENVLHQDCRQLHEVLQDHLAPAVLTQVMAAIGNGPQPAWVDKNFSDLRELVRSADIGEVVKTIDQLSAEERQELAQDHTFPVLAARFFSGRQYWRIRLAVDWGPKAAWPEGIAGLCQSLMQNWGLRAVGHIVEMDQSSRKWANKQHVIHDMVDALSDAHYKMRLHIALVYGRHQNFPPFVKTILEASEGWGTDEVTLLKTIEGLSTAEMDVLKSIPYLYQHIQDEFHKDDEKEDRNK